MLSKRIFLILIVALIHYSGFSSIPDSSSKVAITPKYLNEVTNYWIIRAVYPQFSLEEDSSYYTNANAYIFNEFAERKELFERWARTLSLKLYGQKLPFAVAEFPISVEKVRDTYINLKYDATYDLQYKSKELVSISFNAQTNKKDYGFENQVYTINYDCANQEAYTLEDVFKSYNKASERIKTLWEEAIKNRLATDELLTVSLTDWKLHSQFLSKNSFKRFFLTAEKIVFLLNPGEIGPEELGVQQISIDYDKLKDQYTDKFAAFIKSLKKETVSSDEASSED